jgi:hypothetical protein
MIKKDTTPATGRKKCPDHYLSKSDQKARERRGPDFKIDPEFQKLMRNLTDDERAALAASIRAEGCREFLLTWNRPLQKWKTKCPSCGKCRVHVLKDKSWKCPKCGHCRDETEGPGFERVLLDGHNRLEICEEEGIYYGVAVVKDLPDRQAAFNWIISNQLGRRNVTPEEASYLRGKRYNAEKTAGHGDKSAHQNDGQKHTADRLAAEHNVSKATIERDGKFATQVDIIAENVGDEFRDKVLAGGQKITKEKIKQIADMPPDKQKEGLEKEKRDSKAAGRPPKSTPELKPETNVSPGEPLDEIVAFSQGCIGKVWKKANHDRLSNLLDRPNNKPENEGPVAPADGSIASSPVGPIDAQHDDGEQSVDPEAVKEAIGIEKADGDGAVAGERVSVAHTRPVGDAT